jgi:hypothetical protein
MDDIDVVQFVQKTIRERKFQISDLLVSGTIKDMETYRECIGELRSCDYIYSEISDMLKNQEHLND